MQAKSGNMTELERPELPVQFSTEPTGFRTRILCTMKSMFLREVPAVRFCLFSTYTYLAFPLGKDRRRSKIWLCGFCDSNNEDINFRLSSL